VAIYHPPVPPVFVGGAQPYAPRLLVVTAKAVAVNDPPFTYGGPRWAQLEISNIAQPDPWVYAFFGGWQPFQPRRLPADITASTTNDPPFTYAGPTVLKMELAWASQPDPWVYSYLGPMSGTQPYAPRKLNPSITAVAVNDPPFTYGGPVVASQEVAYLAQPNPWVYVYTELGSGRQPYGQRLMNADLVAVPAINPPFTYGGPTVLQQEAVNLTQPNPWTYTFAGGWQPFQPRRLPVVVTSVAVNNPPFAQRRAINTLGAILTVWALAPPPEPIWRYRYYKVALTLGYTKGYIIT